MSKRFLGGLGLGAAALMFVIVAMLASVRNGAQAAPAAAITPVGVVNPVKGLVSNVITIPHTVTADGRDCRDTRDWLSGDIAFAIDIGTVNTTTLMLEHSNDNANYVDGPILANAVTTDTTGLNRYDLYGVYTCLTWDVATTDTVTITAKLLLHQ